MKYTDKDLAKRLRKGSDAKSLNELAAELELAAVALDKRDLAMRNLRYMADVMRKQYGLRGSLKHGMGKRSFERLYSQIERCCDPIEL